MLLCSFKMVRHSWIFTRRSCLCCVSSLGWPRVGPLPHLSEAAIALVTAQVLNSFFPAESKEMWLKSWSELVRTHHRRKHSCLSLWTGCCRRKKDGTAPIDGGLRLELQRLLFSWHGRFCQTNFFVSNIEVWKWRNCWWLSQECLRYCHFCTFLNTLETGFVQTYSLVSSML